MGVCLTGTESIGTWRKLANGSNEIGSTDRTVVATVTRNANELPIGMTWVVENTDGAGFGGMGYETLTDIAMYFERTTTANQFEVVIYNASPGTLNVQWAVFGVVPPA